jgi:hypothetical protein
MLCVSGLTAAGCRVYNAELVDDHRIVHFEIAGDGSDAGAASQGMQVDDETADKLPACGNARVDDIERCDIAIARGEPGACPEACDSHDPCVRLHFAGQRCAARCEATEITAAADGDGCCPAGASIDTDHDCSPTCGNGTLERGETCDPPSSCPRSEACASKDACMAAHFTGSTALCSARCELQPITACQSEDGCCPPGCGAAQDSDCGGEATRSAAGSGSVPTASLPDGGTCAGASCPAPKPDAGATTSSSDTDPASCLDVHMGGRCEACDCAYCGDEVTTCNGADDGDGCQAVIDCAAMHHCKAIDCLCGVTPLNSCERFPLGPCRDEILSLAGALDPVSAVLTATNSNTGIGRAVSVLSCRSEHCGSVCGL